MTALLGLTEQNDDALARRNAAGNRCDSVKVPGGAHGMGKWREQGSDYQAQLIAWLRDVMN